jgi:hypothetical protein
VNDENADTCCRSVALDAVTSRAPASVGSVEARAPWRPNSVSMGASIGDDTPCAVKRYWSGRGTAATGTLVVASAGDRLVCSESPCRGLFPTPWRSR